MVSACVVVTRGSKKEAGQKVANFRQKEFWLRKVSIFPINYLKWDFSIQFQILHLWTKVCFTRKRFSSSQKCRMYTCHLFPLSRWRHQLSRGWGLACVASEWWAARCVIPSPREHPHRQHAILVTAGVVRLATVPMTVDGRCPYVGRPPAPCRGGAGCILRTRTDPLPGRAADDDAAVVLSCPCATRPSTMRRRRTPQADPEVTMRRLCTITMQSYSTYPLGVI